MVTWAASEHQEQVTVIQWAEAQRRNYPELVLLHALPNAAKRSYKLANYLKSEGLKAGMPDLHLPVARGSYIGLWIEMKKRGTGKLSDKQKECLMLLKQCGHFVAVCDSADFAITILEWYLGL